MSESERKAKRLAYSKDYRKRINAEARAYREMQGQPVKTRRRKG